MWQEKETTGSDTFVTPSRKPDSSNDDAVPKPLTTRERTLNTTRDSANPDNPEEYHFMSDSSNECVKCYRREDDTLRLGDRIDCCLSLALRDFAWRQRFRSWLFAVTIPVPLTIGSLP